jgi:hypothetical protein
MKKMTNLLISVLLLATAGVASAVQDTACKMRCDTQRLTCNQKDAHGLKCGQQYSDCMNICDPEKKPNTSPIASCEQHCEDSGLQCGIANGNTPSCKSGRDACLARCAEK